MFYPGFEVLSSLNENLSQCSVCILLQETVSLIQISELSMYLLKLVSIAQKNPFQ